MSFKINSLMIYKKYMYTNGKIYVINTKKLYKNYYIKYKRIYYDNIDLNKELYIQYNFKKDYIGFIRFNNHGNKVISYIINIKYYNKFIYKFYDKYRYSNDYLKYTKYKIYILNKYELLYYSNYLLIYL
jgi:hypothetical protein